MPVCLRDWLPEDHLAHLISDVVPTLDLSGIYAHYDRVLRGQQVLAICREAGLVKLGLHVLFLRNSLM